MVREGRIGLREAHSLICSPRELGEEQRDEQRDEDGGYGRGKLGCLLSWRAHGGLDPLLFVCECICFEEGTLEEEGACLAGISSACATSDLTGSSWRRHTTTCLCARDSQLGKGGSRAHCLSGLSIKEGRVDC
jgi:hypothetical protein